MEQVLKRPPWWAWFSLMGLEIPSAAIAWAFAVSQSHLVVVSSPWLYQFLFVAVWCVNMLDRVLKIFRAVPLSTRMNACFLPKSIVSLSPCSLWWRP